MVRKILLPIMFFILSLSAYAQIGYQVALVNAADGKPRALETVTVSVTLSDSKGATIFSENTSATSNEFGILSLTVGDANTFSNMDWNNLPLYVSASVDGVLLGKSQVLNVPVAEYAKQTGTLTKQILCSKTWTYNHTYNFVVYTSKFIFDSGGTCKLIDYSGDGTSATYTGHYCIWGDIVAVGDLVRSDGISAGGGQGLYNPDRKELYFETGIYK